MKTNDILREIMKAENITQKKLSELAGDKSQSIVAQRFKDGVSLEILYKYSSLLGYQMLVRKDQKEYLIDSISSKEKDQDKL